MGRTPLDVGWPTIRTLILAGKSLKHDAAPDRDLDRHVREHGPAEAREGKFEGEENDAIGLRRDKANWTSKCEDLFDATCAIDSIYLKDPSPEIECKSRQSREKLTERQHNRYSHSILRDLRLVSICLFINRR
jgi:hypothetical protein